MHTELQKLEGVFAAFAALDQQQQEEFSPALYAIVCKIERELSKVLSRKFAGDSFAVSGVSEFLNCTQDYARSLLIAGEGFNHKSLGAILEERNCGLAQTARMVKSAQKISKSPKMRTLAGILSSDEQKNQKLVAQVDRFVREQKEEQPRKIIANPQVVRTDSKDGLCQISLRGITHQQADIITDTFSNAISGLPKSVLKKSPSSVLGHAALEWISRSGSSDSSGKISTVYVIHASEMNKEEKPVIYDRHGRVISAQELESLLAQWGRKEHKTVILNDYDEIVSISDTRIANHDQRLLLLVEQGGCVFPSCSRTGEEVHHIVPVKDKGRTDINNLALLCRFHHVVVGKNPAGFILDRETGMSYFSHRYEEYRGWGYHPHTPLMKKKAMFIPARE